MAPRVLIGRQMGGMGEGGRAGRWRMKSHGSNVGTARSSGWLRRLAATRAGPVAAGACAVMEEPLEKRLKTGESSSRSDAAVRGVGGDCGEGSPLLLVLPGEVRALCVIRAAGVAEGAPAAAGVGVAGAPPRESVAPGDHRSLLSESKKPPLLGVDAGPAAAGVSGVAVGLGGEGVAAVSGVAVLGVPPSSSGASLSVGMTSSCQSRDVMKRNHTGSRRRHVNLRVWACRAHGAPIGRVVLCAVLSVTQVLVVIVK